MTRLGLIALPMLAPLAALAAEPDGSGLAAPQYAPELPAVSPEQPAAGGELTSTGDADEDIVLATDRDVGARDMDGIAAHEADLRKVLADMPQPFARAHTEDGKLVYRGDSMRDCVLFAQTQKPNPGGAPVSFVCKGNPYPTAAFFLGSYLNEMHRPAEALAVLDQGLLAGPNSPLLITERNAALMSLGRWDDVISATDKALLIANLAPRDRARVLRNRGYALTELKRLDEAQAAYEESLRLEPGNALAQNELTYIAQLKAGAAPTTPGGIFRPNAPPKKN